MQSFPCHKYKYTLIFGATTWEVRGSTNTGTARTQKKTASFEVKRKQSHCRRQTMTGYPSLVVAETRGEICWWFVRKSALHFSVACNTKKRKLFADFCLGQFSGFVKGRGVDCSAQQKPWRLVRSELDVFVEIPGMAFDGFNPSLQPTSGILKEPQGSNRHGEISNCTSLVSTDEPLST